MSQTEPGAPDPAAPGAKPAPEATILVVDDEPELCRALSVKSLRTFGVTHEAFGTLIEKAANASSMKGNPGALPAEEMREVLERAL